MSAKCCLNDDTEKCWCCWVSNHIGFVGAKNPVVFIRSPNSPWHWTLPSSFPSWLNWLERPSMIGDLCTCKASLSCWGPQRTLLGLELCNLDVSPSESPNATVNINRVSIVALMACRYIWCHWCTLQKVLKSMVLTKYPGLNAGLDYAGVLFGIQTHTVSCQRFWML